MSSLARAMKAKTSSSEATVVPKSASTWTQSCWARSGGAEPGLPGNAKPRAWYSSHTPRPRVPLGRRPSSDQRRARSGSATATSQGWLRCTDVCNAPTSSGDQFEVYPLRSKSAAARPRAPSANCRATGIMSSSTSSSRANAAMRSATSGGSGRNTRAQSNMICTPRVRNARLRRASTAPSSPGVMVSWSPTSTALPVMAGKRASMSSRWRAVSPSGGETADATPTAVACDSAATGGTRSTRSGDGNGVLMRPPGTTSHDTGVTRRHLRGSPTSAGSAGAPEGEAARRHSQEVLTLALPGANRARPC